jgi:glycosyltransferase involved in cell wall biosynthesis/VanZ family protein
MNVLIVSEPGESGVFAYVEALCHFLVERGVCLSLAYSDRRSSERLLKLVCFVESGGGQAVNLRIGSGARPGDIRAFWQLWRFALRVRPDVVHCHSSKAGVLGRGLALSGIKASYFYHPHAYYGMQPKRRSSDFIYDCIEAVLGRIGTTIVISSDEERFAVGRLRIPEVRVRRIPNGVDTSRFVPASGEEKLALREAFGLPRDGVILGALCRLSQQKDPLTLYRAFAAACAQRPDLHLFHIGSGELESEVDRLVADLGLAGRVTRIAYLSNPTGFYKSVDGLILTSTYEGLSLAALEAMSADLPLVLSMAPGNNDLLKLPLSHVWSALPRDVDGFTARIRLWHETLRSRERPNHRAIAREKFDSGDSQGAVLSQYKEAIVREAETSGVWSARIQVLAWLALIACESTDRFSRANSRQLLYPAFHILTRVSYSDFFEWNVCLRKFGHLLLYGTLSLLIYRLAKCESGKSRSKVWSYSWGAIAFLGTAAVASLDEWHQTTIPSRTGTIADVLLDAAAALAMQIVVFLISDTFRNRGVPSILENPPLLDRDR